MRIHPTPTSRLEPLNRAAGKVGQASRLPSERVSASMPVGFAAGGRRDACPTLRFMGRGRRVGHVALVEVHVFFRQVGGIHHGAGFAEIQVDVQIKFLRRDGGAELLERRLRRLAALETPQNFPAAGRAVANVHLLLHDRRRAVADGVNDAAPVRVAAVPACFHERAVGHRARGGIGILNRFRAVHAHGHDAMHAFAVAHDFLGQFEADVVEGGLKNFQIL